MILTVENAVRVFEDENYREKEELIIPDFIDVIDTCGLASCKAKRIYIPSTVTYIGKFAFAHTKNVESIYVPSSVAKICGYAFANSNVKFISLSWRTNISKHTFDYCYKSIKVTWRY